MAVLVRQVDWRHAAVRGWSGVGAAFKEKTDDIEVAVLCCAVERSITVAARNTCIGSGVEKFTNKICVAVCCCGQNRPVLTEQPVVVLDSLVERHRHRPF